MALVFVGGRPEGLVHIESSPRRQGKLQGSSPMYPSPVTSVIGKRVPLRMGEYMQSFPNCSFRQSCTPDQAVKKTNIMREENLGISAVVGLN